MTFAKDKHSVNAMGGTERMKYGLEERISKELLDNFQIFVSRVEELFDESKIRIYWAHDMPEDPATEVLANGGWQNFHKLVFVSNWQMQGYIRKYNIPWSHCVVLHNAIEPIPAHEKPKGTIRLAYWSTPHRGLDILIPVFKKLAETHDVELDVYSSFSLYGWGERDEAFADLFKACEEHPKINYYGTRHNYEIREALTQTHILAYPNTWQETSCLVLMEAMSAGLHCIHPNFGALYETAANWTNSYQYHEDKNIHAAMFYHVLKTSVENYWEPSVQASLLPQKFYADAFYSWDGRKVQWLEFLNSLLNLPRELPKQSSEMFEYNT